MEQIRYFYSIDNKFYIHKICKISKRHRPNVTTQNEETISVY